MQSHLRKTTPFFLISITLLLTACEEVTHALFESPCRVSDVQPPVPVIVPRIVKQYPHDDTAFTQGLVFNKGELYESTGRKRQSGVRIVELETGRIKKAVRLQNAEMFGEGITIYDDHIIQLTWKAQTGYVYDAESLGLLKQFSYRTREGWGLTHDGQQLIMSDGSSRLYFLDPHSFQQTGSLLVREHDTPVEKLNELEYINGEIFANVWKTNCIARISPDTGQIIGWLDLQHVAAQVTPSESEGILNGIAYDANSDRLWVTGKLWSKLFEITF